MIRYFIFIFIFSHASALAEVRIRPSEWAVPVIGSHLKNIYQVDKGIYRSEQPGRKAFEALSKFGITEVLNLRQYHSDNDETRGINLKLHRLKLNAGLVSENEIIRALSIIQKRKGPILIHCWHGSDRTGVVIAAYRIIFQQWSKMKASDEMANGGYGYHSTLYPNLAELIKNLNVSKIRNALDMHVD